MGFCAGTRERPLVAKVAPADSQLEAETQSSASTEPNPADKHGELGKPPGVSREERSPPASRLQPNETHAGLQDCRAES